MGIKAVTEQLEVTFDAHGFKGRAASYDYGILNNPEATDAIVLRFGGVSDEIDTFGSNFLRTWIIEAEVYGKAGLSPDNTHDLLLDAIDKVVEAVEKRIHLGTGSTATIRMARVVRAGRAEEISLEQGTINWLRSILYVAVQEEASHTDAESE